MRQPFLLVTLLAVASCGGVKQSQACAEYVECFAKASGVSGTLDKTLGPMGSCWDDQVKADNCTGSCKSANEAYQTSGIAADAGCTITQ